MNKLYIAVLFGNCLTKYNQALFSLLAPVWAVSFLNKGEPIYNLGLTYSFFIVDWIARPLGAFFWGWLADSYSISKALLLSFLAVTISIFCFGMLPVLARSHSIFFTLMFIIRLMYSFSAAGETTNGVILLLEHSAVHQYNQISSLYDISSTAGSLLAAIMMLIFSRQGYLESHWERLFYFSSILCVIVLLVRLNIQSTITVQQNKRFIMPLQTLLQNYWKKLIALMAASGFSYATYNFSFVLIQGYIPLVIHSINHQFLLEITILLICVDIILLPILAKCANIWGYRSQMLGATMIMIVSMPALFYLMEQATTPAILFCRIWIMILGVAFSCTYHAWAKALLPDDSQCRLAALGYTLGTRIIGMPSLVVSIWLFQKTALIGAPLLYLGITAIMATIAVYTAQTS